MTILYVHGMGGGENSRIPSILAEALPDDRIVIRTYDFDPDKGHAQVSSWVEEVKPDLVIGESLGAIHAISIKGIPHLLVSPALNGPTHLVAMAYLSLIPGVTALLDRIFKPKEGPRQQLHFVYGKLRKWGRYRKMAKANSTSCGSRDSFFAFFGSRDHYRRSSVVLIRTWRRWFGPGTYLVYDGTHFMEDHNVRQYLIPAIERLRPVL